MLQDYSTNIGKYERKKSGKELDFVKYKIASLNLDSNDILDVFSNPAINERQVFMHYSIKVELDLVWARLERFVDKLHKGMGIDEVKYIEYKRCRPFVGKHGKKCKTMGIVKIYPEFLEEPDKLDCKNLLTEEEVIDKYGKPPE